MPRLSELLKDFESIWPASHAELWDSVGLVAGSHNQEVNKVLVSVDLTQAVVDEAESLGVDLILTHHPVLYKPISAISENQPKGALLSRVIRASLSVFSAHTNADAQIDGSSSLLASAFGAVDLKPLVSSAGGFGHGSVGTLSEPKTLSEFADVVSNAIPVTARGVAFAGEQSQIIRKIAVCGGAGDSFLNDVIASNVDVYVTSDLRHHTALDALETPRSKPLALIDISHFAAESLWVKTAAGRLREMNHLQVFESRVITDVWTGVVSFD